MKNTRKGFTLVELLVVIAMLAILATVTVIGLTGCIEEAKLSVDQQGVEQMNTALEAASVTGAPKNFKEFDEILTGAGFNTDEGIRSLVDGYAIYWYKTHNVVVLAKKDGTIVAPTQDAEMVADFEKDYESLNNLYDLAMCGSNFYVGETPVESLEQALEMGGTIDLASDFVSGDVIYNVNKNVTINLNGFDMDFSAVAKRPFNVQGADVTLTINAGDSTITMGNFGLVAVNGNEGAITNATIVINGGNFVGNMDYGTFIKAVKYAEVSVELYDVNYKDDSTNKSTIVGANPPSVQPEAKIVSLKVEGGTYDCEYGFVASYGEIKNATIKARGFGVYLIDGTVSGCNITTTGMPEDDPGTPPACVVTSGNGTVAISNSTLNAGEGHAMAVYTTSGTINATNCTISGASYIHPADGCVGSITVDGDVVASYPAE